MIWRSFDNIQIGADVPLEADQLHSIVTLMRQIPQRARSALGGRIGVVSGEIGAIGAVVVKGYARGGIIGFFNRYKFLRWGGVSRPEQEFAMLEAARRVGVSAPEPLAVALIGGKLYRGWLLMREIPHCTTLVELAAFDEEATIAAIDRVVVHVKRLIAANILHIDLHPGNILVSKNGDPDRQIYLIDFDKAAYSTISNSLLRDRYLLRWRRAVLKHNLPDLLNERFCYGLRSN